MSNTNTLNDFYQVPGLSFDINKLRQDLDKILKKSKYQTLGITNFHAIPMNMIPGDESSIKDITLEVFTGQSQMKQAKKLKEINQLMSINIPNLLMTLKILILKKFIIF